MSRETLKCYQNLSAPGMMKGTSIKGSLYSKSIVCKKSR